MSALAALALAPTLLVAELWNDPQLVSFRHSPTKVIAAVVGTIVVLAILAPLFNRRPALLPVLSVAALPFRLPVATGGLEAACRRFLGKASAGRARSHASDHPHRGAANAADGLYRAVVPAV
jgi:hypothetical protein